jgi:uncharacterized Zn finger protein
MTKVEDLGNVYRVNDGSFFVSKDPSAKGYDEVQEWLTKVGNSLTAKTKAAWIAELIPKIKAESKRRIHLQYNGDDQSNVNMSQISANITTMNNIINAIRDKSDDIEASLDSKTAAQLKVFDITANGLWNG